MSLARVRNTRTLFATRECSLMSHGLIRCRKNMSIFAFPISFFVSGFWQWAKPFNSNSARQSVIVKFAQFVSTIAKWAGRFFRLCYANIIVQKFVALRAFPFNFIVVVLRGARIGKFYAAFPPKQNIFLNAHSNIISTIFTLPLSSTIPCGNINVSMWTLNFKRSLCRNIFGFCHKSNLAKFSLYIRLRQFFRHIFSEMIIPQVLANDIYTIRVLP